MGEKLLLYFEKLKIWQPETFKMMKNPPICYLALFLANWAIFLEARTTLIAVFNLLRALKWVICSTVCARLLSLTLDKSASHVEWRAFSAQILESADLSSNCLNKLFEAPEID